MKTFQSFKKEQMQDPAFREAYLSECQDMEVAYALICARTSAGLSQKELAERTGISQSELSKLERGLSNPSVALLKRLAEGMGMKLKIQFIPADQD